MLARNDTMQEKRQFERAEFNGAGVVEWAGRSFDVVVRDLSVGGAYVVTAERPTFGAPVKLIVQLPALVDKGVSTLGGIVRWVRDDGFGIQFGPTGALETYGLAEYVARKTKTL
jgi:hypothetical protein